MLIDILRMKTEPDVEVESLKTKRLQLQNRLFAKLEEPDPEKARKLGRNVLKALSDDKNEPS